MIKTFFCFFLCHISILTSNISLAQNPEANRANIWYFGNGAGLDFSSGSPVAITNGALHTNEGCASMCDLNGNLLMYTDGDTIWDRNHNPMPNGTGLMGCSLGSSIQAGLIMPQPLNSNLYYVFTTDCGENNGLNGLRYSVVDMSLNGGLGDIISTQKNVLLMYPVDECLTGIQVCDTVSWILTHMANSTSYYCYKLTNYTLNSTPIINQTGQSFILNSSCAKFSSSGRWLALSYGGINPFIELYAFDINTGTLSNLKNLTANGGETNIEFSPNENYLYVASNGNLIHRFDISSNNEVIINSTYTLLLDSNDNSSFFTIQNSLDGKSYVAALDHDSISVINYPNTSIITSNLSYLSIPLNGKLSKLGLPNFSTNYFSENPLNECINDEIFIPNVFSPNGDGVNDLFTIEGLQQGDEVAIYNRWGTKVYEFVNINDGWDGRTTAGEKCTNGIYYYYVKRKNAENKKGFIHLFY
jgi:gliding motility-associated-like protein